jgi:predicted metal-binding membrane protein
VIDALPSAWMPLCGGTWADGGLSFMAMWTPMMTAMMLPALVPALRRYARVVPRPGPLRRARLVALVAAGYWAVWVALGVAVYPVGAALTVARMRQPWLAHALLPATAIALLLAGLVQCSAWKAHALACCRVACVRGASRASDAWREGVRLGLRCVHCCAALTAALLAWGMMDPRAMVAVTVAITLERWLGARAARAIGVAMVAAGMFTIARRAGA